MKQPYKKLASKIDDASQRGDIDALNLAIEACSKELDNAKAEHRPILFFYQANCHAMLADLRSGDPDYAWSWQQDERISEILCLRKAVSEASFDEMDQVHRAKIYTNLGNSLDQLGRCIEAIHYWDSALSLVPNFAMALGNKGLGLTSYGRSLYDCGHTGVLVAIAFEHLESSFGRGALWDSGEHPEAENIFKRECSNAALYLSQIQYDFERDLDQWSLGKSKEEKDYRGWCLHHKLFLSPLNDACKLSVAAQDVIHLPSHTYSIGEKHRFSDYYNILKQEYVSARYMLYEAMHKSKKHFSDKDVLLLDGYDAAEFGYRVEQLKAAFRITYSLFDKIALFINEYFSIGMDAGAVSFRRIWGAKKNKIFTLRPCFENSQNWSLRGLYYLSKDLFDEQFVQFASPDAKALASLRNYSEHRFLSLQFYASGAQSGEEHSYIEISEFEGKVLKMLSMVREALIYLSLAMHREEYIRSQTNTELSVPVFSQSIKR